MSGCYELCFESCLIQPMPTSVYILETCNTACDGGYTSCDARCLLFICIPITFIFDMLIWCPRCGINCYKIIKEKKSENIIIDSQPGKN